MTARQVFEGLLTELSKVNAPSMLLQDFNYFFNKAVNQYINKRYNIYDIGQQTTDDLRVLKATTILEPTKITDANSLPDKFKAYGAGLSKLFGATYEVNLPLDYLHMLNCVCIYKLNKRFKCYDAGNQVQFAAKRLTADSWSVVINDFYNRPLPERPYYYIHNVNQSADLPTNPLNTSNAASLSRSTIGTDVNSDYGVSSTNTSVVDYVEYVKCLNLTKEEFDKNPSNYYTADTNKSTFTQCSTTSTFSKSTEYFIKNIINSSVKTTKAGQLPRTISLQNINNTSLVEREAGVRYGNPTNVRMEIRYGHDDSVFELVGVFVDYIKAPQTIRLTQEQVNLTEDTSQIMEFPDYVCQEIINELVHLVMENTADPRLQTHIPVTQSIANPAQQQAPQPQPQQQQTQRG